MVAAEESVGDQLTLTGNLNNLEILRWTPEETTEKSNALMEAAAAGGGFVLGIQGPELPIGVDDAAIKVLVDAGHNWKY
jgi:uroporphyrinogen-III decarboxylase